LPHRDASKATIGRTARRGLAPEDLIVGEVQVRGKKNESRTNSSLWRAGSYCRRGCTPPKSGSRRSPGTGRRCWRWSMGGTHPWGKKQRKSATAADSRLGLIRCRGSSRTERDGSQEG